MTDDAQADDVSRAHSFNRAWRQYRDGRPGYPERLLDDMILVMSLTGHSRVLEIGAGTGNFTVGLLRRGISVTAVDPGADLLNVLEHRVPVGARCQTVVGRFEEISLPDGAFDAVVSCHSWHWLDPDTRLRRCLRLLRPGGTLGIVYTGHLRDAEADFAARRREVYSCWAPHIENLDPPLSKAARVRSELEASALVGPLSELHVDWTRSFDRSQFVAMLGSYSNHILLPADRRGVLLREIGDLVADRPGGRVHQTFRSTALLTSAHP